MPGFRVQTRKPGSGGRAEPLRSRCRSRGVPRAPTHWIPDPSTTPSRMKTNKDDEGAQRGATRSNRRVKKMTNKREPRPDGRAAPLWTRTNAPGRAQTQDRKIDSDGTGAKRPNGGSSRGKRPGERAGERAPITARRRPVVSKEQVSAV